MERFTQSATDGLQCQGSQLLHEADSIWFLGQTQRYDNFIHWVKSVGIGVLKIRFTMSKMCLKVKMLREFELPLWSNCVCKQTIWRSIRIKSMALPIWLKYNDAASNCWTYS